MNTTDLASELVPIIHEKLQFLLNRITMGTSHVILDFCIRLLQLFIFSFKTFQFLITSYASKPRITSIWFDFSIVGIDTLLVSQECLRLYITSVLFLIGGVSGNDVQAGRLELPIDRATACCLTIWPRLVIRSWLQEQESNLLQTRCKRAFDPTDLLQLNGTGEIWTHDI